MKADRLSHPWIRAWRRSSKGHLWISVGKRNKIKTILLVLIDLQRLQVFSLFVKYNKILPQVHNREKNVAWVPRLSGSFLCWQNKDEQLEGMGPRRPKKIWQAGKRCKYRKFLNSTATTSVFISLFCRRWLFCKEKGQP